MDTFEKLHWGLRDDYAERIEAEMELDLEDRTPYPLLCCMCQSRGEDWTDVDLALPRIFDGYSCHHPIVGKCKGTQETVRAWKDCQAFRRMVQIWKI